MLDDGRPRLQQNRYSSARRLGSENSSRYINTDHKRAQLQVQASNQAYNLGNNVKTSKKRPKTANKRKPQQHHPQAVMEEEMDYGGQGEDDQLMQEQYMQYQMPMQQMQNQQMDYGQEMEYGDEMDGGMYDGQMDDDEMDQQM